MRIWLVKRGWLGCLLALVVGCHPVLPPKESPLNQIKKTLEPPVEEPLSLPKSVKEALLPPMHIPSAASSGKMESRFDIAVFDVPAKEFFLGLVEGTPHNITVHPGITGTVSLQLTQVTVPQVLEIVRDLYGYEYDKTPYGYKILAPGLRTQIFQINYLNLQRFGESQIRVTSGSAVQSSGTAGSSGTTTTTTSTTQGTTSGTTTGTGSATVGTQIRTSSNVDFWKVLEDTLKAIISAGEKTTGAASLDLSAAVSTAKTTAAAEGRVVIANPQAGVILARATPSELRAIEEYLDKTQLSIQRQVILEAKILEVELKDGFQAGIDWNWIARIRGGKNITFAQGVNPLSGTLSSFGPVLGSDGKVLPKKLPLDDLGIVDKLGGVFSTALNFSNFEGLIQLLETQGNVQVLSSPQVSTVNNQKAVIRVGNDEFFVTGINISQTTTATGTTGSQTITPVLTPLFSGIALDVTPQISVEGYITLHIHPSITDIRSQGKAIPLGTIGGSTGTGVTQQLVDLALTQVRESDTVVRAQSGQVVVIGGLIQNKIREATTGFPWLSAIPYVGSLFRQTQQQSVKSELVILLKPRLIDPDVTMETMGESLQRFRSLDRGFHFGSRPEVFGMKAEKKSADGEE